MVLRALPSVTLAVVLGAAACSGSSGSGYSAPAAAPDPSPTAAAPAAAGPAISISGFSFSPHLLTVKVGAKVTVTNADTTAHTWTAKGGAFDSGELAHGRSFSFTFAKPGTYAYVCSIHPSMTGSVVVTP